MKIDNILWKNTGTANEKPWYIGHLLKEQLESLIVVKIWWT